MTYKASKEKVTYKLLMIFSVKESEHNSIGLAPSTFIYHLVNPHINSARLRDQSSTQECLTGKWHSQDWISDLLSSKEYAFSLLGYLAKVKDCKMQINLRVQIEGEAQLQGCCIRLKMK